jgi:hypothetical protein
MYLNTATGLEDIVTYGMNPIVELMNILEDEIVDDMDPDSREYLLWIMLKGTVLQTREVAKRIHQADVTR